jgi:hypothetical protein
MVARRHSVVEIRKISPSISIRGRARRVRISSRLHASRGRRPTTIRSKSSRPSSRHGQFRLGNMRSLDCVRKIPNKPRIPTPQQTQFAINPRPAPGRPLVDGPWRVSAINSVGAANRSCMSAAVLKATSESRVTCPRRQLFGLVAQVLLSTNSLAIACKTRRILLQCSPFMISCLS